MKKKRIGLVMNLRLEKEKKTKKRTVHKNEKKIDLVDLVMNLLLEERKTKKST